MMDARELILTELRTYSREEPLYAEIASFTWDDSTFLRACIIRLRQGDDSAWLDFVNRLHGHRKFALAVGWHLDRSRLVQFDLANKKVHIGSYLSDVALMSRDDANALLQGLSHACTTDVSDKFPSSDRSSRSAIMYFERKDDGVSGPAHIGRVTFSKSGKSLYYAGRHFHSMKDFKANFFEVGTKDEYWISGCKKNGGDRLYPGTIEIDDDVREEYWSEIRNQPENNQQKSIRCRGKYGGKKGRAN